MLTILPDKELAKAEEGLSREDGKDFAVLVARSAQKTLGYIVIDIIPYSVRILDIRIADCEGYENLSAEYLLLADALLRCAVSYGINRSVFRIETDNSKLFAMLKSFRFEQFDNKMMADASKLTGNCKNC